MIQALLWDVDGTLAETERDGHRVAFNRAFEAAGLAWHWDVQHYGELLHVSGGRERLLQDMASRADAPVLPGEREALARRLHAQKNRIYAERVTAGMPLRDGVLELMQDCRRGGVRMAIATTTSAANLDALLGHHLGQGWRSWFDAVVCGEDVSRKKPDPEVFRLVLSQLGLSPLQVLALEDSPGGVAAARAADVPVAVTRSFYFARHTIEGAVAIGPGLHQRSAWRPAPQDAGEGRVTLDDLCDWQSRMELVSQHG